MGALSPVPLATAAFLDKVEYRIIQPTVNGINKENIEYVGFIFFGLISVKGEPYVIEYNCRMGDPETEVVMPRLESDLVGLLIAATQKELSETTVRTDPRCAATIMTVSRGYPLSYEKGFVIEGLDQPFPARTLVFQAGTSMQGEDVITNGGRVLSVTSYGESIEDAVNLSLDVLDHIHYEGMYYRTDIGYEFKPE
jgi:phosphoribosylamine--glycine ligase